MLKFKLELTNKRKNSDLLNNYSNNDGYKLLNEKIDQCEALITSLFLKYKTKRGSKNGFPENVFRATNMTKINKTLAIFKKKLQK